MSACRTLDLDAYLRGELDPPTDASIAAHARTCEGCAGELAWLRAEHRVFTERSRARRGALPDFDTVLARAAAAPACPRPFDVRPWLGRAALGMCAAAALVAVIRQPGPSSAGVDRRSALPVAETVENIGAPTGAPSRPVDEALEGEPMASGEAPRMTCRDAISSPTEEALVAKASRAAPPQPDPDEGEGACTPATPASRAPSAAVCDAHEL